ncbi:acyl carrier protein [Micromonospora sp. NBC_00421]|uniref:acyl carrier protein n=1 Tax=Micromonospora sp. NBC_00421 TaxID=2975976 RepID=UPI002E1A8325
MSREDRRRRACGHLVAAAVIDALAASGPPSFTEDELIQHEALRFRDLAMLGLSSFDRMALASRLEDETGVELDDEVLTDPRRRSVASWSECLFLAGALRKGHADLGHDDEGRAAGTRRADERGHLPGMHP